MCLVFACCHGREFALAREKSGRVAPCPGQLGSGFAMRDALASLQKRTDKSVKKKKKKRGRKEVSGKSPLTVAARIRTGQFALTGHSLGLFALKWSLPGEMSLREVPVCS